MTVTQTTVQIRHRKSQSHLSFLFNTHPIHHSLTHSLHSFPSNLSLSLSLPVTLSLFFSFPLLISPGGRKHSPSLSLRYAKPLPHFFPVRRKHSHKDGLSNPGSHVSHLAPIGRAIDNAVSLLLSDPSRHNHLDSTVADALSPPPRLSDGDATHHHRSLSARDQQPPS
jgi:hypothetical protein